jgi:hypothetical protein
MTTLEGCSWTMGFAGGGRRGCEYIVKARLFSSFEDHCLQIMITD